MLLHTSAFEDMIIYVYIYYSLTEKGSHQDRGKTEDALPETSFRHFVVVVSVWGSPATSL
jgi:hypothetical protein